jgi:hypothetical protein
MNDLRSVVYVSTATMPLTDAALECLLVEARDLNLASRITGVLLCCDGNFMQCFEGAPADVHDTYERIRNSRRHRGLIELMNEPVAARAFADWQMGFARMTTSQLLALSTAHWQSASARANGAERQASGFELLRQFWINAR